ncbi:hypothetical protein KFU94_36920 [Chloroflexi bacterium TSY]|nr:hypothetical protein [Chloroflexi bacterium TSY]
MKRKLIFAGMLYLSLFLFACGTPDEREDGLVPVRTFYVDSESGDDANDGSSARNAWQSLEKVSSMTFEPGDHIYFRRGSSYSGCVTINGDGTEDNPIVVGAYGEGDAPSFTNPDPDDHNGNALQVRGDYQIVENLFFHYTPPAPRGAHFIKVWRVGALHVGKGHDHAIIRHNEFSHVAKAIQSNGEHTLITHNYIHDGNEREQDGFLSHPYWGPIGIHLGIGNQEVSYNRIENMFVEGGQWGGDGGAIEIDNGLNHKDNIHIHHNITRHNMGFLEISWEHDIRERETSNIVIEHNVSRDFQSFVLWWAFGTGSRMSHNTIIRTDSIEGMALDTVFQIDGQDIVINDNIVVVHDNMWAPVYVGDGVDSSIRTNNYYWDYEDGNVFLGPEPGVGEFIADPLFVDFANENYELQEGSPAIGLGALNDEEAKYNPSN